MPYVPPEEVLRRIQKRVNRDRAAGNPNADATQAENLAYQDTVREKGDRASEASANRGMFGHFTHKFSNLMDKDKQRRDQIVGQLHQSTQQTASQNRLSGIFAEMFNAGHEILTRSIRFVKRNAVYRFLRHGHLKRYLEATIASGVDPDRLFNGPFKNARLANVLKHS